MCRYPTNLSEEALGKLVGRFYEASVDPELWSSILETLRRLLRGSACLRKSYNFETLQGKIEYATEMNSECVRSYEEYYAPLDVWMRKKRRHYRSPGMVRTGRQIVSHSDLVKTEFYNEWLKPQEFFHTIRGVIDRRRANVSYTAVLRTRRAEQFGTEEVAFFRLVMPHIYRAFQVRRLVNGQLMMGQGAMEVLNRFPFGIVLLDADGHVLTMTDLAEYIIAYNDGLTVGRDRLQAARDSDQVRLRQLVCGAAQTARGGGMAAGGALAVSRPSGLRSLLLLVSPLRIGFAFPGEKNPAVVVFVSDPERRTETHEERLHWFYGLTSAEARLAALLTEGRHLDEAAQSMGVTYQTARTHLKRIFLKTDTDRQAALVRLLLMGPAQIRVF